jgi:hypothetical protein
MRPMITDEIISFQILSRWRSIDFVCEKSQMTLSLNGQHMEHFSWCFRIIVEEIFKFIVRCEDTQRARWSVKNIVLIPDHSIRIDSDYSDFIDAFERNVSPEVNSLSYLQFQNCRAK